MTISVPPAQLNDNLWMLGTARYPAYVYRDAGEAAIVEGSIGAVGPILREQIEQVGIDREAVRQVIITHAHPDHVMAVPLFRETFPGICVLASALAAKTLAAEKAVAFFCKMDDALAESLTRAGEASEEHRRTPMDDMKIDVDRTIGEGDVVAIGKVKLNVLETPGHSDCSLSFHDPEANVLIISDASGYYLPDAGCWWPNYFSSYEAYVNSLKRLSELGAETLCLSHNAVIQGADDVSEYLTGAITATQRYHVRIIDDIKAGKSVREVAEALGAEVYELTQLMPLDFFQKNCAILVKQSLQYEGIEEEKPADKS